MSKHVITVVVTVKDDETTERTARMLKELAGRFRHITGEEFMKGGIDLMGYDGAMVQRISTKVLS
jgi:hypothetical protein